MNDYVLTTYEQLNEFLKPFNLKGYQVNETIIKPEVNIIIHFNRNQKWRKRKLNRIRKSLKKRIPVCYKYVVNGVVI